MNEKKRFSWSLVQIRRISNTWCLYKHFDWQVELLREKGNDTPLLIIIDRKIDHISDVYEHLKLH